MARRKLQTIDEMPLAQIKVAPEVGKWLERYFVDIAKRHATDGNIHKMMLEAYVLGVHHCMKATQQSI